MQEKYPAKRGLKKKGEPLGSPNGRTVSYADVSIGKGQVHRNT